MTMPTKSLRGQEAERRGRIAEVLCLVRLWLTGWRVVAHRLAGKRGRGIGEVDIVAARGSVLAFIEVKARGHEHLALESISPAQRQRIQTAALSFLAHRPAFSAYTIRFDAMVVVGQFWPKHIPDAWRVD